MARRRDNDDEIVVALDSWTTGEHTIIQNNTYRESHPAVRERPEAFISWYSTTDERTQAHLRLMRAERVRVGLPE